MNAQCPHCSQRYKVSPEDIGGTASCQTCGKDFVIEPAEPLEPPPDSSPTPAAPEQTVPCPYCGEQILAVAKKCKHCREFLDGKGHTGATGESGIQVWCHNKKRILASRLAFITHAWCRHKRVILASLLVLAVFAVARSLSQQRGATRTASVQSRKAAKNDGVALSQQREEARETPTQPRKTAKNGDAESQFKRGVQYYSGEGVGKDYAEAVKWYRKAAEQGHAAAQCRLGRCYYTGEGVEKDYAEAVKWYMKAAEQDHAEAQWLLAECYNRGNGVETDYTEFFKWLRKAADLGNAEAQFFRGAYYAKGVGVPQDMHEAVRWYRKAAAQGHVEAQRSLKIFQPFEK